MNLSSHCERCNFSRIEPRRRILHSIRWIGFLAFIIGCRHEQSVVRELVSPSSKYRAVLYADIRSGVLTSCTENVGVVAQAELFEPSRPELGAFLAFSVSCESDVTLKWSADTLLAISYTIRDGVTTYQRSTSRDGNVHITYVPRP
jgi:hypothetical protein